MRPSTGDIEALRPIIEAQANPPTVSYGGPDDAVDYLKTYSADGQGIENLAILLESAQRALCGVRQRRATIRAMSGRTWPWFRTSRRSPRPRKSTPIASSTHEQFTELVELEAWYYWRVYIGKDGTTSFRRKPESSFRGRPETREPGFRDRHRAP